jgi:hypothetical protein
MEFPPGGYVRTDTAVRLWLDRLDRLRRVGDSRDRVTEGLRVLAHARVACQHRDELRRFAQQLDRCQVDRVERTNGLDREGTSGAYENRLRDADDRATAFERLESSNCRSFLVRRQSSRDPRQQNAARRFSQREGRRDASCWTAQGRPRGRIMFKEPGEKAARLDIDEWQRTYGG